MNAEEEKFQIKFKDGTIRTLTFFDPQIEQLKEYFKSYTNVNYNTDEWIHHTVIRGLKRWLNANGFHHPAAAGLIVVAEGIIAYEEAKDCDGYVAIADEDKECLVVCLDDADPYVFRISKIVYNDITGRRISQNKLIVSVELLNDKSHYNMEELHYQLKLAVQNEDFELAAKLRDEINRLQKPGLDNQTN